MVEFYIGTAHIDMARSQITTEIGTSSLEPKVMQVLLILAQNQGRVVNHETILRTVWPNTVTSANAIQRCVGQLRKVLNDTARSQQVIATYPKIGYSLIPKVRLHSPNQNEPSRYNSSTTLIQRLSPVFGWRLIISVFLSCVIMTLSLRHVSIQADVTVKSLTPLTATDNIEQKPSFSPDGQYIVFQRFLGNCKNQLWARRISTSEEHLLTREAGNYGVPRWSPDGERIVFTSKAQCNSTPNSAIVKAEHPTQKNKLQACNEIRGISFHLAKVSPQPSTLYHHCELNTHNQPVWLTNSTIAFITRQAQNSFIQQLDIVKNNTQLLHKVDNKTISALDYSRPQNKLAWIEYKKYMPLTLSIYDPKTLDLDKVELGEHHNFSYINHIRWLFDSPLLLISKNNQLISINLSGEVNAYLQPTTDKILYPAIHPSKNQLVASMGNFDRDIGLTKWYAHSPQALSESTTFSRSNVDEFNAKQQPNGKLVAFISSRSGSEQVWLHNQSSQKDSQLSNFTDAITPVDILWNKSESALFILANKKLYLLSLSGKLSSINTPYPLLGIYQDRGNSQLLVKQLKDATPSLALLNLNTQKFHSLYFEDTDKALLTRNDDLFTLEGKSIFKVINKERHSVSMLDGIEAQGLFTYKEQLYIISSTNTLWQYHPRLEQLTLLAKFDRDIDSISGISVPEKTVYFSEFVSIKKELMLLDLE
ncbi:winged helix-turn-helix domain-containing protein [Pseudoalteromonas umbrosa]|uniref:winged helix-turn-helix domain-containing protein n=1 Tax=Pseudoalteromonas umbrosa TaxID=3048489 RepID=UPI0024C448B9|nr:winged helix-turn-helix domain-containing protein [Pseudoalteromonas sp. B95]MDK1285795.1 winged helix-turn-helix domain-containing protein [Pseudoalteromonas sp. B95]